MYKMIVALIPFLMGAHHYKGLPHYSYFENYPQVPILEFIQETPQYELFVTIYNFQGLKLDAVEAPNDVRFYIYIYDVVQAASYKGKASFSIFSDGQEIARAENLIQEEETIYALRKKIEDQDDFTLRATFSDASGSPVQIDLPIQITESFFEIYGVYVGVFMFFVIIGAIKMFIEKRT